MKKIFILALLLGASATAYASSSIFSFSKLQQNRLNMIVKQLKIAPGDYRLTITSTGVILREYEPTIVAATGETITKEKVLEKTVTVEKIIEVPKEVIVEKILPDPRVVTGSVIFSPSDIERINYCGRSYSWVETTEVKTKRLECLIKIFYDKGGIYPEI